MTVNAPLEDRPLNVVVGRNVHMLMWDRRLTQAELGAKIGMDQSSLGKRLRGERGWTLDQVAAVASALGTSIAYLTGETADRLPSPLAEWAPWGSNPRPADYIGVGSASNRITFAEVVSIDAAPRFRELVTA